MGMDDLDDWGKACEEQFGLISGMMLYGLHTVGASPNWDINKPSTIEIVVSKENAASVYGWCKEIRSGYSVGINRKMMAKIKEARLKAHQFLWDEANDPNTSIERKIELVKLTSKNKSAETWD